MFNLRTFVFVVGFIGIGFFQNCGQDYQGQIKIAESNPNGSLNVEISQEEMDAGADIHEPHSFHLEEGEDITVTINLPVPVGIDKRFRITIEEIAGGVLENIEEYTEGYIVPHAELSIPVQEGAREIVLQIPINPSVILNEPFEVTFLVADETYKNGTAPFTAIAFEIEPYTDEIERVETYASTGSF